jgi:cytoskeletal protein CcmA (bactofilin family)
MDSKTPPEDTKKDATEAPAPAAEQKPAEATPAATAETEGGVQASNELDSDAQGGGTVAAGAAAKDGSAPPPPKKSSPLKSLWEKFNIYLLLFLLVIVIAVAALVILTAKSKQEATNNANVATQTLSANQLKQLASTGTTVGNANEVLNIESSAVFAGTVLIRNNLEVAGSLQVSDNLSLPSITVSGQSTLSQVQAQNLVVSGPASIQGLLSAKNSLDVSGDGSFSGSVTAASIITNSLQLSGILTFTNHVNAGGTIPRLAYGSALGSGGTASISGSDTAGSITINTGGSPNPGCFAIVSFTSAFSTTPHVEVTPINFGAAGLDYYVTRTTSSMSVCSINAAPPDVTFGFDYIIFD